MAKFKTTYKRKSHSNQSNFSLHPVLFLLLSGSALSLLYFCVNNFYISQHSNMDVPLTLRDPSTTSTCWNFFSNHTHGLTKNKQVRTTLIQEYHGQNEHEVANCLDSILSKGDHLLIESPKNGKEIVCDDVQPAYKRFNGKAKCFGVDVPIDEARRRYADFAWRANFISQKMSRFFMKGLSPQQIIKNIINFSEVFRDTTNYYSKFENFNVRNAKYLKQLALKMRGLNIEEMHAFLIKENNLWADKANYYEKLSRSGPTNQALNDQIGFHKKELANTQHKLFVVYGANHLNFEKNKELQKLIEDSDEPTTLLSTRKSFSK